MRKVAIFDIDGTIFRSSLTIEITNALIAAEIFPARARQVYRPSYTSWLDRKGSYGKYLDAVVEVFDQYIRGVRRVDFLRVARRVVTEQQHRVYRYTRDLIQQLRKRRYFLVAISHSPTDVVEVFGKRWGFNRVYGLGFELGRRGVYTGRITFDKRIHDKAKILQHLVAAEKLSLRGSLAVGDSEGDIPMLKLVDRPICFNPNSILYKYAKRKGWEVVVERKDVVYKL